MLIQQKNDVYVAPKKLENDEPLVSVVITTKNEEKNIENCLISIREQSYENIEIIVIDNFSTDETKIIATRYTKNVASLGPERSAQRNHGMINIAKGEYVIYVDADMILSPILIESCVATINQDKNITALYIPELILGRGYFSRVRRFERKFYDGTVIDGARFFNRRTFCSVGGFDEILFAKGSGEDWDIDKKIKKIGKIGYLKCTNTTPPAQHQWLLESFVEKRGVRFYKEYAGIYHNESDFKLMPYLRKKLYYSKGFEGYINKWGRSDEDVRRQFSFLYRYITVFIEKNKWKRLFSRIDLLIGMYFLRIAVGFIFIYGKYMK